MTLLLIEVLRCNTTSAMVASSELGTQNTLHTNAHSICRPVLWKADIEKDPPTVDFENIQAGPGMGELLAKIVRPRLPPRKADTD